MIGESEAASGVLSDVLRDYERLLGPDHHDTILTRHYIAIIVSGTDSLEAIKLLTSIRTDYERILGADSPRVLQTRQMLTYNIGWAGEPAHSAHLFNQLVQDRERILGARHPHTIVTRIDYVHWMVKAGDRRRATEMFRALIKGHETAASREHVMTDIATAVTAIGAGRWAPMNQFEKQVLASRLWTCREILGPNDPLTLEVERIMRDRPPPPGSTRQSD